ncbi:hypothetical protein OHA98_41750 [Streptomyces sp. NBC_00654]|uniref:hypothetical protein n=1 Tax=Streptomyces sp. NBC_00654 TaxID=2975799 RepID=UPI0022530A84|nr:hypothetical protein [Streptomyces sp. NBC_00654]MCX4969353.1 hypothetical protein [Streptomyces sp. NBC_00654]MCX4971132.1 hypothetical protein [Streptomyces sp. NBC_00654]
MPQQRDALTELVKAHVGRDRRMSTREFSAVAVDPDTGWSPSKSLTAKIIGDQGYDITPQLVGAVAIGLGLDREIVAAAAHLQVIGYTDAELSAGAPARLIRAIGAEGESTDKAQAVADRWDAEK